MKQGKQNVQNLRQSLRKSSRRQTLQERFSQKRRQNLQETQKLNQQVFDKIINLFDQQEANYLQLFEQHKELLKFFSCFEKYCFRLLNLSSIVYESFLRNPSDQCTLQILKNICFYEEIEIPQTEQFVGTLINLFFQKYLQIGEILFYLTRNCKYGLFCARLVDKQIISIISQVLYNSQMKYSQINRKQQVFTLIKQKESLNYFIFQLLSILASLFTIQPILNFEELQRIGDILNLNHDSSLDEYYTFFIGKILEKVVKQFQPSKQVAQLLLTKFQRIVAVIYQDQDMRQVCIDFIQYSFKSQVLLSTNLISFILEGFNSNLTKNKIKLMRLILKLAEIHQDKMEIQANKIVDFSKIPSFLQFNSMFETKKTKKFSQIDEQNQRKVCQHLVDQNYLKKLLRTGHLSSDIILKQLTLKVLFCLVQQILTGSILQEQPCQILQRIYTQEQFLNLLQESVINGNFQEIEPALNIISSISSYLKEQQIQQGFLDFRRLLQENGIVKVIQGFMSIQNNKAVMFESENIFDLLYH